MSKGAPMTTFYTKYKRPEKHFKIYEPTETEQAGYISAKIQIENLIRAGINLINFRKDQYDFTNPDEIDFNVQIPVREPNFDLADASAIEKDLKAKQKEIDKKNKIREKKEKEEKDLTDKENAAIIKEYKEKNNAAKKDNIHDG